MILKFIRNDTGSGKRPYHGGRLYDTDRIWVARSDCISVIKTFNENDSLKAKGIWVEQKSILEDSSILSHVTRAF